MTVGQVLTVVFVVAFLFGLRSTARLWMRTRERSGDRLALVASFAVASTVVTVAAGLLGFLGVRRMLGLDPLDMGPLLTLIVASAVGLIPEFLDYMVTRVEAGR